jgi:methyl-accepting chemotaxis protein
MALQKIGFKLSVRLMTGVVLFLLAFIVFHIMVGQGLKKIDRSNSAFHEEQLIIASFVKEIIFASEKLNGNLQFFQSEGETSKSLNPEIYLKVIEGQEKNFEMGKMPDYFKNGFDEIHTFAKQIALLKTADTQNIIILSSLMAKINHKTGEILDANIQQTISHKAELKQLHKRVSSNIILWMSVIVTLITIFYIFIIRSIRIRVQKTLKFSQLIASGDLTAVSEFVSNDEIGMINDELETLKLKLREILLSIKDISGNIMNASYEFNSGSQLISSGASSQASSSEEISAAMEQISEVIKKSAENAITTGVIAKNAFDGIQHGANKVESALLVIEDIARKNSIIGEISYQTKILSINASVEAARAAELGKGFAVVAEEVKRLAETTQSSAHDIGKVSKKGVQLARQSADELRELVQQFQKTSELVNQIAEAGLEHNTTIEQINFSLQELNNITQQNASSAQELAASSNDLVNLTQSLNELILQFKITSGQTQNMESGDDTSDSELLIPNETDDDQFIMNRFGNDDDNDDDMSDFNNHISHQLNFRDEGSLDINTIKPDEFQDIASVSALEMPKTNKVETREFDEKFFEEKLKQKNLKSNQKGVRINLTDNDELDSQFEKIK